MKFLLILLNFFALFNLIEFFSWGRWTEIHEQGTFKRGWKESDVEDCARIIVSLTHLNYIIKLFHDDFFFR